MDFNAQESTNGIRMAWNVWPESPLEAARIAAPVSCLYTPLKVDFRSKLWLCPFCKQGNPLPPDYAEHIKPNNLPMELQPSSTTVEYVLQRAQGSPPVFLLVLDVALIEEELNEAKDSLQQALARMPPNALVGFITFGAHCHVHELTGTALPRAYAFRGGKDYTARQVGYQLGLATAPCSASRFVQPVGQCEFTLNSLLDELCRDAWPLHPKRAKRCTGTALSVALALSEAASLGSAVRVTLVLGGPGTVGPGLIVGEDTAETIRSHVDLSKGNAGAQQSSKAMDFYDSLARRAAARGWAVDIFACALDQVGLHEMKVLCDRTGGYMVMGDSFSLHVFKQSFCKIFDCDESGYLNLGFDARIEVFTSQEFACSGAIGSLASLGRQGPRVSAHEIGESGTCQWAIGSLDKSTTIGFYFEITNQEATSALFGKNAFLQFQTAYLHPSGRTRLRVTTVSHRYANSSVGEFIFGFDQEAAAVLVARQAVEMSGRWTSDQVVHMLDRMLIKLMTKFASYRSNDAGSFSVSAPLAMFPQFMYHLRRSNLIQTFNSSPDETAFYRAHLLREGTLNSLVMIQPVLLEYSIENGGVATPVLLDEVSLKPNTILLLDGFFHLVIWRGRQIQGWCEQGIPDLPEYPHVKALLQAPAEDARQLLQERFPVPRFIQTCADGSQERFLTCRVNPSGISAAPRRDRCILTDDVSLKIFMEHLIKYAVES